jgi:hypothetical protein
VTYNTATQIYRDIPLQLIVRRDYPATKAKRFTINGTNQNVWIPNKHLTPDGTIIPGENLDYVFRSHSHQLDLAGITQAIPGIKRAENNGWYARKKRGESP